MKSRVMYIGCKTGGATGLASLMAARPLNSWILLCLITLAVTSSAAFGQIADDNVRMRGLVKSVVNENDDEARGRAILSLYKFNCGLGRVRRMRLSDRTIDAMVESLKNSDELTKSVLARVLGTLGTRARFILPQLTDAFNNDYLPKRQQYGSKPAAVSLYQAIYAIENDRPQSCDFGKP